jgi:hypothetical protein
MTWIAFVIILSLECRLSNARSGTESVTEDDVNNDKRLTTLFLATMLTGFAYTQTLSLEQFVVQKFVEAPVMLKERLFEKSKVWFARTFRQSMARWREQNGMKTIIQYQNKGNGELLVNGSILYPHVGSTDDTYEMRW